MITSLSTFISYSWDKQIYCLSLSDFGFHILFWSSTAAVQAVRKERWNRKERWMKMRVKINWDLCKTGTHKINWNPFQFSLFLIMMTSAYCMRGCCPSSWSEIHTWPRDHRSWRTVQGSVYQLQTCCCPTSASSASRKQQHVWATKVPSDLIIIAFLHVKSIKLLVHSCAPNLCKNISYGLLSS